MIPKYHGVKLHEIPDEHLTELLPVAKKIAIASGAEQYNVLQNNGRMAHQMVDHVHCKLEHLHFPVRTFLRSLGAVMLNVASALSSYLLPS